MPYKLDSNLFFLHIPKTGGSSIERCLGLDQLKGGYKFKYIKNNKKIVCTSSPQHLTIDVLEDAIENFKKFKHFTIVRNPYDRLVSEYHFSYDCRLQNKVMLELKDKNIFLFKDFIKYIFLNLTENTRQVLFDNHFVQQVKYVQSDIKVKIFKLEEINKLEKWLQKQTKNPNLKIPHDHKSQSRKNFEDYITDIETLNIINSYYKEDFELFNYKMLTHVPS